jgi:peptidoglycan/xylan/chitin deacetylase (PgdA/CDA1 family)
LTFDDGKRSQARETAPELVRLGVPAVFYVPSGFLSQGTPLWFDRHQALVQVLGGCPPGLEAERLKLVSASARDRWLEHTCAGLGLEEALDTDDARPMSWEEARQLHWQGFSIGAHGVTHAILTRETRERAMIEIEQSLARVSAELGTQCETFAFPNGNYTLELARHAMACGARFVVSTDPTWVDAHTPLWRLPRVQLFGAFDQKRIQLKLALAAVRGVLPNPDGSGRAYRRCNRLAPDQRAAADVGRR